MTMLEIDSRIGRNEMQLIGYLSEHGHYIGVDVTRESIIRCVYNISTRHRNFEFHHFDAERA
jgi:hypothetical protein